VNHGVPPSNEPQAPLPMPVDVREYVIAKLAEILVADYQLFHGAPRSTVVEGSVRHRRLRLVAPRK
jgi:hypothetical protein